MARVNGIILELFPPLSWDEHGVRTALEIVDLTDDEEVIGYTDEELTFLSKSIEHYMNIAASEWGESFEVDTDIDFDDPNENGRFVVNMDFPPHLEPPASMTIE